METRYLQALPGEEAEVRWLSKLMGYWEARCSGCNRTCGDRFMYCEGLRLFCPSCYLNPWLRRQK